MSVGKYRDPVTGEWKKVGGSAGSIPSKLPNPYPLTINGEAYDGSKKLEVNTKELVVTVTGTQESGYTADKTYDDVLAALDAGRTVVCLFNGEMFSGFRVPLAMMEGGVLVFVASPFSGAGVQIMLAGPTVSALETIVDATIGDQVWDMGQSVDFTDTINNMIAAKIPAALKNPNALTINGTSYDGSAAVEVNIPKGDTGQRGTGLLPVTSAPSSYTTAVGGITPKYRMAISTIKTQAGVTEVLLGDTVRSSYYHYPIAYLDASYAYFTARVSIRGATGAAGAAGSDATVTKESIETALGYTPVSPDDIPAGGDNVPDYVRTEAERVAAVVQSRQNANTFTFIAMSDAHFSTASSATVEDLTNSVTHMGQAMQIIREQVHVDLTVSLGDMVWDALDTPELGMSAMRYVSQCLFGGHTGATHLRARGNHDSLYKSNQSNGTGLLTDAQVFANVGAWNKGSVFDPDNKLGGYCYRDFEDAKLRVIILNSSETNTGGCLYSAQQITWLTNALDLTEKGDGWRSIVMSHHPLDWSRDGGGNPITAINGASGLICSFHGHTHNYLTGTVSGTELLRAAIPNACSRGRENEYADWSEATTYSKVQGTKDDTAFCVVTIDLDAHKIYADHYGAGYDREIEYVDSGADEPEKIRNEVEHSTAADSDTELYNGTGYKLETYLSSSGGDAPDDDDEHIIATGYIPYDGLWAKDNVLYIKGADVTTDTHIRIYGYTAKGATPSSSAICSGSTLSTYFTVETLGDHYYKLTHTRGATVSWLRLSLELPDGATGEDFTVTINQPIE